MIPRVLTKARMPTVKTKQCEPKLFGSQARFVCEAKCAGNHTSGLRSNSLIKLTGVLVVLMPMAIYLLNKIYSSMNLDYTGKQMSVCFNVMIMLLILTLTNIDLASVYSRDGASSYLNKVQPTPYALLLFAKLFFPIVISFIGTMVSANIFAGFTSLSSFDATMVGITVYAIHLVHLFSAAESDIMNPQYARYICSVARVKAV